MTHTLNSKLNIDEPESYIKVFILFLMNRHHSSWLLSYLAAISLRAAAVEHNSDLTHIVFSHIIQNTDNLKSHIIKTTITILSQSLCIFIAHPAPLSFCLICAEPLGKLSTLHFNHKCNDASIYLYMLAKCDVKI